MLGIPGEPSVKREWSKEGFVEEAGYALHRGRGTQLLFKKCVFSVVSSAEIPAQALPLRSLFPSLLSAAQRFVADQRAFTPADE